MEKEEKQLIEALKKGHQLDSPSLSFTANVMRKVEEKRAAKLKPLLGKWTWISIAACFLIIITIPFFVQSSVLQAAESYLSISNLTVLFLTILIGGLFILFDEFYLRKRDTRS